MPTRIKGATNQMLPWKAPYDPKTLPMGLLHDYMSCWTTLWPFRYPGGPQNDPKQHQNGLKWLKITRMTQNGTAWPQITLKHLPWVYYMIICHVGSPWALFRGPWRPHNGPAWPKMALYDPKCPCMTPNGPRTLPMGILHEIVSCWTTLGPFQRPTGAM